MAAYCLKSWGFLSLKICLEHGQIFWHTYSMSDVKSLLRDLGHKRCAQALGRGASAIRSAAAAGEMPAHWYPTIQRLAEEKGLSAPMCLFRWKPPLPKGDGVSDCPQP